MTKVIVYVEGPSDRLAMNELLAGLLVRLRRAGVSVDFVPTEGKRRLMVQTPKKAINILLHDPSTVVVALPDLYPKNIGSTHTTAGELKEALEGEFRKELQEKLPGDLRPIQRFRVFCFKHDLEALILAAEEPLASRLGVPAVERSWVVPVEDQDHDKPPKRIVEQLFKDVRDFYKDTIDAPLILGAARYQDIAAACPQCFKPFVDFLESMLD